MNSVLARAAASVAGYSRRTWDALRRHPVLALSFLPAVAVVYVLALIPFTPGISDIRKAKTEQPTVVLTADGKELAVFRRANREWVKLSDISPDVVAALIATEDHRFYEHHGIDVQRTISAVLHTMGGNTQGGSTITQQLARNFYPDEIGRSLSITRKLKEAITALKIESIYSKDEILETYLNTVPFLYNAYGIEMAARTYFDKTADTLDVLESATLIGMLKGTQYYNPVMNPERAERRRNTVLAQMVKHDKLDAAKFEILKKKPLKVDFERQTEAVGPAPHLSRQLRRWLIEWADRRGYNIYADGLVVHTTIDSRLQALANEAVERQVDKLQTVASNLWSPRTRWAANKEPVRTFIRESQAYKEARGNGLTDEQALKQIGADANAMQQLREDKTMLQAGFMALEPGTGQIKAWVGSRGFEEDQFDHVAQARRQPGSTFKPFVYGAAFEQGMKPSDTLLDGVVEIPVDNGKVWRPSDGGAPSGLDMTLRDGLAFSKNTITAQLTQRVGAPAVANLARAMGVRQSKLHEVLSLGLGTSPVTLKEMVTAYGTLANSGNYIEPMVITRVDDRWGKPLEFFTAKASEPAMSVQGAQTLVDVMRGVIDRGTGTGIRSRFGIEADVAGKTGTTQDNTDAWFILMHPQLVAGAWVGFNDNRVTMGSDWGQGARSALPIVGDFFQHSLKAKVIDAAMRFPTPPREPDPAPMPEMVVEPVEVMPPGVAMPVDPAPPPQAVTTETVPVVGGAARVDRVERPTFGLPVFPPLPRDAVPAATIQQQVPAATIQGPAVGPSDRPTITIPVPPAIPAPALPGPQTVDPMAANRVPPATTAAAVATPVPTPYIVESRPSLQQAPQQ